MPRKKWNETLAFKVKTRFPRLKENSASKLNEKILHRTYNKMSMSRNSNLQRYGNYDVYKTDKGDKAVKAIKLLSVVVRDRKIDPDTYIKVMCRYGKFANSRYMPQLSWLIKKETLDIFETWFLKRERNKYELKEDWRQAIAEWNIKDVYKEMNSLKYERDILMLESVLLEYPSWAVIAHLFNNPKLRAEYSGKLEYYSSPRNTEFRKLLRKRYKEQNR